MDKEYKHVKRRIIEKYYCHFHRKSVLKKQGDIAISCGKVGVYPSNQASEFGLLIQQS